MPIIMNNIVHTMGKSQPGGDSGGLLSFSKVSIPPLVMSAESPPTASGIAMETIIAFVFDFNQNTPKPVYERELRDMHSHGAKPPDKK